MGRMGEYLGKGQTFQDVVEKDAEILKRAGVTHQQVGDALEKVLQSYNWFKQEQQEQKVNNTLSINVVVYFGTEICPYDKSLIASKDYLVSGIPNGNKAQKSITDPTRVTEMMPDLIRKLRFFEGNVKYGIQPEWAIRIFEIVEIEGANIWIPKTERVYRTGSFSPDASNDFCGSFRIRENADEIIQLAPGAMLYMKGEEGIIFAERKFQITPGLEIDGLQLDAYCGEIWKGQTFVSKYDKLVG